MNKNDVLFICDFETTDTDPKTGFPIELGGLFVDSELFIKATFHSYIRPEKPEELFIKNERGDYCWKFPFEFAYRIHNISPYKIITHGLTPAKCVWELGTAVLDTAGEGRCIICSDNAQFEYNFMQRLFELAGKSDEFPFHYCAWDTSLLLDLLYPDIGDAVPVHSALEDAFRLYRQLVRAAERIGFWKS